MKKFTLMFAAALCAGAAWAQEPMLTFKTNVYATGGEENVISFMLGTVNGTQTVEVDFGDGRVPVEVQQATVDGDQGMTGTWIQGTADEQGIVKVYGDAANIDYFYAQGAYIEWVEIDKLVNLEVIDLSHNELKALDLTPLHNLYSIEVGDNTFSEASPLIIGKDKPQLAILEFPITTWLDPSFDLKDYPSLGDFDAYACQTLFTCDPTGCPDLQRLSLDSAPVSSLDVSKNPHLKVLNVSETRMTTLDVSQNPELQQLYMTNMSGFINTGYRFSSIDVSNNPLLSIFYAGGNDFTSVDVSKNPLMFDLGLEYNQLSDIDISKNPDIYYLNIKYNNMDYATIPAIRQSFSEYYYEQRSMPVQRSYPVGATIDLSARVLRPNSVTTGALYTTDLTTGEGVAVSPDKYEYADGVLTLKSVLPDSCYMAFENSDFPGSAMYTTSFVVKDAAHYGEDNVMVDFNPNLDAGKALTFSVGIAGASEQSPAKFFVDFGDGAKVEYTATTYGIPATPNVSAKKKGYGPVVVYAPEGADMTAFAIDGYQLFDFDITPAVEIRELSVTNAGLFRVDLSYNRRLTLLNLSNNEFSSLDLAGINGGWEKNVLYDLNLSHNHLTEMTVRDNLTLRHLDISYNDFEKFDGKNLDNVLTVDVSHNKLEVLNMEYMTSATSIDASYNNISSVTMPATNVFQRLDLSQNAFTLANLPVLEQVSRDAYVYAPQRELTIARKAPSVNLSEQDRVIDGQGTTFTWKTEDGATVPSDKIECKGGVARFLDIDMGKVYCEMTNPAFPQFQGADVYRTTMVQPAAMPTNVVAEFTTSHTGDVATFAVTSYVPGNAVFIDWRGDGTGLEMYPAETYLNMYQARTFAGAKVKAYTYDADDQIKVFSISDAGMDDFDGTGLTNVYTFTVANAGLSAITMPKSPSLAELDLSQNKFTKFDFSAYPGLTMVSMPGNLLTELVLKDKPYLGTASFSGNQIHTLDLQNLPNMFALYLSDNDLDDIDLSPVPSVSQLALEGNHLSNIDCTPMEQMVLMLLDRNLFTFQTLPLPRKETVIYSASNQAPIDAACVDGKVDLSSQASVNGVETQYAWYWGMPQYNEDGELVGDLLDPENDYTLVDGVTTFHVNLSDVVCLMTNTTFPYVILYTPLIDVHPSGIREIGGDLTGIDVTIHDGTVTVTDGDARDGVVMDVYAMDGRKVATAVFAGGTAQVSNLTPAPYAIVVGNRACKVIVR